MGLAAAAAAAAAAQKKKDITYALNWAFVAFLASRDAHLEKKVRGGWGELVRRSKERREGREGEAAGFRWTRRW